MIEIQPEEKVEKVLLPQVPVDKRFNEVVREKVRESGMKYSEVIRQLLRLWVKEDDE